MKKTNILLLSGGLDGEREVNLMTAENIVAHLGTGFSVQIFDLTRKSLPQLLQFKKYFPKVDVVLIAIAGTFVEDGYVQAILESQGVPHTGSSVYASAAGFDKGIANAVAAGVGLFVPHTITVRTKQDVDRLPPIPFPVVVKPVAGGSSIGVRVIKNRKTLLLYLKSLKQADFPVLLSKFISGVELTCPVLDGHALPVVEIVPPLGRMFDYQAKYFDTQTREVCPAKISKRLTRTVQQQSELIHKTLGCAGLTRTDFIYDPKAKKLFFIEINTLPGLSAASLAPKSAAVAGISMTQLLRTLVKAAR
jgi:D-alanine-D-alanine ligase